MKTKMYTTLFNAITDALEDLDKGDTEAVRARLVSAQRETEAMFMDARPEIERTASAS